MKRPKLVIAGVITALASLWLGDYGMENIQEWAKFPCFMTAVFGVGIGFACCIFASES